MVRIFLLNNSKLMKNIETKIIKILEEWNSYSYDPIWLGYETLSDETKCEIKALKTAMKRLSIKGLVELQPLYDANRLTGRGWFLVKKNKIMEKEKNNEK